MSVAKGVKRAIATPGSEIHEVNERALREVAAGELNELRVAERPKTSETRLRHRIGMRETTDKGRSRTRALSLMKRSEETRVEKFRKRNEGAKLPN